MAKAPARELDELPQSSRGKDRRKPEDTLQFYNFKPDVWHRGRLLPGVYSYAGHWVDTVKKDGSKGSFYVGCSAWDPQAVARQGGNGRAHCPWCALEAATRDANADRKESDKIKPKSRFSVDHYMNFLVRKLQQKYDPADNGANESELASGIKEKDSDSVTPIVPLRLTDARARKLNELKDLNVHEVDGDSQSFRITDPKYGCDIMLKWVPTAKTASESFLVNKSDPSPLKKSEKAMLVWDFSDLQDYPTSEENAEEFKSWATRNKVDLEELGIEELSGKKTSKRRASEDDDEDDDIPKTKPKAKKAAPPDDDDLDDDDEDDDPPPKKSTKKPAKASSPFDDDDDEDDAPPPKKSKKPPVDDDEDDDIPPPKKGKAGSTAKPKRPPVDDDDDDDEAPPPKKSSKKPPVEDDDEDDDIPPPRKGKRAPPPDDDDEDDDILPPKKSKKPPVEDDDEDDAPPPKKSSKKPPVYDDDDEDDDIPPPKKSSKKPAAKSKRPPADEDDDDLDD